MNPRIKELAEQATQKFSRFGERDSWEKLFAELIVKECIVMADEFELDVNRSGLVDRMKKHFGVER